MANPLAPLIDELGDLEKELSPLRLKLARVESLRKLLRESIASPPSGKSVESQGYRYVLQIGPRAEERRVNLLELTKALGWKVAMAMCSVTLSALAANNVAPEVQARVITSAPTGSRTLKIFERVKPA